MEECCIAATSERSNSSSLLSCDDCCIKDVLDRFLASRPAAFRCLLDVLASAVEPLPSTTTVLFRIPGMDDGEFRTGGVDESPLGVLGLFASNSAAFLLAALPP